MSGHEDRRVVLLAVGAWAGAWAGTSGEWPPVAAVGLVGLVGSVAARRSAGRLLMAVAAVFLTLAGMGLARSWLSATGPVARLADEGAIVTLSLRVGGARSGEAAGGRRWWAATAAVITVTGRGAESAGGGPVRVFASGQRAEEWVKVPVGASVAGVFQLRPAAAAEGVAALAEARSGPRVVGQPGAVDAAVTAVRAGLAASVAGLPPDPRALVPALVVGETAGMSAELREQFQISGLTHLTAVSGANLTIMLAALLWFGGRLGVLGWWRRGLAVLGALAFVVLCRGEPSVLRAAAMGLVGLAALGWGGRGQGTRFLAWAVLGVLLFDPWLSRSAGFALSVLASAGIIWFAARWARRLSAWLPRWLAEAVTVPLAAQVATQPLITVLSGQVSLVGVVANLVAAPLVGPATVLGFLAAGLSVVSPQAAAVAGWLAGGFTQALCWVAGVASGLPGASISWPSGPVSVLLLVLGCGLVVAVVPWLLSRPALAGLLVVVLLVVLLRPLPIAGWPPPGWQLVSCDVGQGDASVVRAGPGSAVVIDAGPEPRLVDRCLDQLGISEVPWLVLTHLHADHVGGVAGVFAGRRVGAVLFSGITEPPGGWRLLQAVAGVAPPTRAVPGLIVAAGAVRVEVLAQRPLIRTGSSGEDSTDENDSSVVMRVRVGGLTALLAGDLEEAGQRAALAASPDLAAQVVLVPHHGSARQVPEFLPAVGARVALVSVGADNDYGHPSARTLALASGTGAALYRTDRNGAVAVSRDGDRLLVHTQRGG